MQWCRECSGAESAERVCSTVQVQRVQWCTCGGHIRMNDEM